MTQKLAAQGSNVDRDKWDDGPDHDDVTKIYVCFDASGIQYIYFDYVKSGIPSEGSCHGYNLSGWTVMVCLRKKK